MSATADTGVLPAHPDEAATPPPAATSPRPRWLAAATWAAGLLLLSTLIVLWARTRPGFDPYGWLTWGRQTLAGNLDTNAAPSWKPLPYVFTVPFALFGHLQLWLWLITAVAVSLSGAVFGGRIAHRLTRTAAPDAPGAAAAAAAILGGAAVLGIAQYSHYVLSAQSDPMIVALCLGAVDAHLSGRRRTALVLATLAGLGRPEVWPFLGLYALWLWRTDPRARGLIAGCGAVTLLLWFGIPALTSRTPFVAASNAMGSGRRLHSDRVFGTIQRFLDVYPPALGIAALAGLVYAALRRERLYLVLAAGILAWVVVEIGFALHGWPGLSRYMFEPAALMAVLGAGSLGRLLVLPRRHGPMATAAAILLALVAVGSLVPPAISRGRDERRDLRAQRGRTTAFDSLAADITRLGGAATLRGCGEPVILLEDQTMLAWQLHLNVSRVGFKLDKALRHSGPVLAFTPRGRGWRIRALRERTPACRAVAQRAAHLPRAA